MRTLTLRILTILACCCAVSQPLRASTVLYRTDAQLVALSERVVHGRVVGQRSARGGPEGRIYTVTTLRIIEDLTGIDGDTVEIWELGGRIGDEFMFVGGAVEYQIGQEVVVFLERGPRGLRSVAMGFSKFDVLAEANGDRRLRRNLRDTVVVGGVAAREPMLSELRTLTTKITGRAPRPGRRPSGGEELSTVAQPFTKLGGEPGWRWAQADSGTPVNWYKNTSAPPPLTSGDAVAEIQTSLSAWTDPPSASIILQYAGTTFQSSATGPWSGLPNGSGVITFEDPNNEISGSTLAIGGGSGFLGQGGTVNGTTYNGFTRGYVIFQNAADLSPSFRQSLNFSRVMEHEIGHAIGLGHTQTDGSIPNATSNIMYPSCCSSSTPVPPALGPDDLAGINFIYPSNGPACSYSLNPTSAPAAAGGGNSSVSVSTTAGCNWSASSNDTFLGITSGSPGVGPGIVNYSVAANTAITPRSGTLTIAGQTFTVNQAAATCSYTLTPTSASSPAAGGSASVSLQAPAGCAWTAVSNAGFIAITSPTSGSGNATITYNVSANSVNFRSGTMTIGGHTFTVNQFGTGPTFSLDKLSLRYGATLSGTLVTAQTTAQVVRLTQSGGAAVTWTATSNQPWLTVNPTSGSGSRALTVTVALSGVQAPSTVNGTITITFNGAGNTVGPIPVALTTMVTGTSANPIGVIDTPLNNTTGVVGAIPVTGWSLDDVDVMNLYICRAAVTGESWNPDGRCGGGAPSQVFLGEAVFIEGARPDVQAAFPALPRNYRGGWGFMVLTNMLPSQGNGPYTLFVHAVDRDGHSVALGSRNITCDNANATKPFGAIDTPAQGGIANGSNYVNFGWALTPMSKTIPTDGSTIAVFVDGTSLGSPSYNHFRSDIATLFPGYNNSNGAVGFKVINTTTLTDGIHTIAWTASDNQGATEGIGSRYFIVANATQGLTAALEAIPSQAALAQAPTDQTPIIGRRGWDMAAPWRAYAVGSSGRAVIRGEEIDRFELWLGDAAGQRYTGYLRAGDELTRLPVGSQLDPNTGVFTWSPGIGYVGTYDLVFVRWAGDRAVARRNVRVILRPKSGGFVGTQVEIDVPQANSQVGQPFLLTGWAADLDAGAGTGIDTLHVWAIPVGGGTPIFLGTPHYGGVRPDVAAVHGDRFRESGFALVADGLAPGTYDLSVFAWSNVSTGFAPPKTVRVRLN
jgi:Viral BACON domain/Matrixin/Putative binding domain, N-terminal